MAATERDYYEVLGVDRSASDDEIKRAFRKLARELHPDVSDAPDAEARFREAAEAYEVLSSEERRTTYDRYGHAGLRGGGYQPSGFDFGNLSDLFSAFFGEGLFGGAQGGERPGRGGDVGVHAEITLAEALTGTRVQVTLQTADACERCAGNGAEPGTVPAACPTCRGSGRVQQVSQTMLGQFVRSGACPSCGGDGRLLESPCVECEGVGRTIVERTRDVEVPAGIEDGQRIRLRGEGHAGAHGGPAGDAFIKVTVTPLAGVERDGDALHTGVELTMTQAALGVVTAVPTPEGDLDVSLPPGTQPGDVVSVRGKGMPSLQSGRRGDLHVHVRVRIPSRLSDEQRQRLEQLDTDLGEDAYSASDGDDGGFFGRLRSVFR
jgi:molecular chaperone DnaJ